MRISILSINKINQYLVGICFIVFLSSCGSESKTNGAKAEEVDARSDSSFAKLKEEKVDKEKNEKYIGEQFGYRLELPSGCSSHETSDGYGLTLNNKISLSIYTENIEPELIDIMGENCANGLEFQFSPEYIGTQCINDTSSVFSLDLGEKRHFFVVKNWSTLSLDHKTNINTLLKSITFFKDENDERTA